MIEYHKIQTLFKRDMDGSITGKKGKMMEGEWTTPELEYLADKEWEFTEKVDGTNIRVGWNPFAATVEFGGRTDSAVIPKPLLWHLQNTFTPELFFNAGLLSEFILFGEGYGPKIQGGGKYRDDTSFVLFDIVSKGGTIEEWITNHSDQPSATQSVDTSPEACANHVIEKNNERNQNLEKNGTNGHESIVTLMSNEPTILRRAENGTYERSLESPSNSMRNCLNCKVGFVPSAISQKLQKAEMETLLHSPLTTATILYVFEGYCAEHVMSACNKLTSTLAGSRQPQTTSHDFWLSRENVNDIAKKLDIHSVPVVGRGTLYDAINMVKSGIEPINVTDDYVIPRNHGTGLMSAWGYFEAEGIVARPVVDLFNRKGERIICKIKSVDFK